MTVDKLAFGLVLRVPFFCPALPDAAPGARPDVVVEYGTVPRVLDGADAGAEMWESAPGRFLFRGGRFSGRFLVERGSRVTVERNPAAEDRWLVNQFIDEVLPAVLQHRGLVPLHAATVADATGAFCVGGASGAGKSTTAAALCARGFTVLADDLGAFEVSDAGAYVLPGVPRINLTEAAARKMGIGVEGLPRLPWRQSKVLVSIAPAPAAVSRRLRAIFLLEPAFGRPLSMRELSGFEKLPALHSVILGPVRRREHEAYFSPLAKVAQQAAVFRLVRPAKRWSIDDVVERMVRAFRDAPC